jgi:serine/threonine protein kinase
VDAFRKFAVAHLGLTEYQAALIQRGRADGFQIGGYTVLDRLGKGATGGVYKAAHPSGQLVAIKVLPGSRAADPRALARFRREGRLLTQLDHPNVVRAFEVGRAGRVHFIVMEYLDGEPLDRVIHRRGKLPPPEAVRLARQALFGLQHLHDRRMVHRDLKPANIMVTPGGEATTLTGTVKLVDVGASRELADAPPAGDGHLTLEGALLGSPKYLPPEQARDARTAGPASDQYGLGCVLFHLIAGRPPYPDDSELGQLLQHAVGTLDRLPGAPPGLQAVVDRLTDKDPTKRYPTAGAAAEALAPFEPADAAGATASVVLPAYTDWLADSAEAGPEGLGLDLVADPPPAKRFALTWRDAAMIGVGVAGTLVVGGVGLAVARL